VKASIKSDSNPSHELSKSKVRNFHGQLENISKMVETTMNPFVESLQEDSNLYCLADGKKMPDEVKEDLLNVFVMGDKWKDEFVQECLKDPARFERLLPRKKVKNFASAAVKTSLKGKNEKVIVLKTTRDLFGRLLYIACTRKVELMKVFAYPLTPVPLSLASIYGKMKKIPKNKLAHHLQDLITHTDPKTVDVVIYDAMCMIQSLPSDLPVAYGNVAELVLKIICRPKASEVHFVCDSYGKSIKNIEQQARGTSEGSYYITGADQIRPKDFRHALRSSTFKTALIKFFIEEWKNNN
jgi:hypothetical protein